ncbi:MAG: type II secretion system F family protein [Planctomycetales bacterium]|nr:type II secretion system F family protein [Planctomycetales bacterium]
MMNLSGPELVIAVLIFCAVFSIGASVLLYVSHKKKKKSVDVRMLGVFEDDPFRQKPQKRSGFFALLVKLGNIASHGRASSSLWEQLIQAGYLNPYAPTIYAGLKVLLFIVGFFLTALLLLPVDSETLIFSSRMTLIFVGATLAFFLPNLSILYRMKKRHDEIYRYLPEAVDLLEICVSSGLGLDMAWNIVADEIRHVSRVLSGAMSLTNFEMHLGVSRIEAMKHMADRTGVDELKSLAAILIQTDRFGTSIAETLQIFARSIREERNFAAQEIAEKMSVKMLFPLILFIFPAVLIVLVGPAVLSLKESL